MKKAKIINKKTFRVDLSLYDASIYFIIGSSDFLADILAKRHDTTLDYDFEDSDANGLSFPLKEGCAAVWMNEFSNTYTDYKTLVHEIIHAISLIFQAKGIKADLDIISGQEIIAYPVGWVFEQALRKLQKYLK